jgi:hypothetical protein
VNAEVRHHRVVGSEGGTHIAYDWVAAVILDPDAQPGDPGIAGLEGYIG